MSRLARCGALLLVALLSACSTPGTRVILLPQPDGSASAVVVGNRDGRQTLDRPYARATARNGASGAPVVDQADAAAVRAENPALFDLRPPPAQRYTIYYEAGGTVRTAESQRAMSEVLAAALARSGSEILVIGHTDTKGSGAQNDALSLLRAQQVRQMFIDRQFPADRIDAVGRGERELAVPTADNVDEPRNRRVMVEVR